MEPQRAPGGSGRRSHRLFALVGCWACQGPPQPGMGRRRNRAQPGLRELGTRRVPGAGHTKASSLGVSTRALEAPEAGGSPGSGVSHGVEWLPRTLWHQILLVRALLGWRELGSHCCRAACDRDRTLEFTGTSESLGSLPDCGWQRGGSWHKPGVGTPLSWQLSPVRLCLPRKVGIIPLLPELCQPKSCPHLHSPAPGAAPVSGDLMPPGRARS